MGPVCWILLPTGFSELGLGYISSAMQNSPPSTLCGIASTLFLHRNASTPSIHYSLWERLALWLPQEWDSGLCSPRGMKVPGGLFISYMHSLPMGCSCIPRDLGYNCSSSKCILFSSIGNHPGCEVAMFRSKTQVAHFSLKELLIDLDDITFLSPSPT